MCDEATNNAKCLFDGGDCCKENKDTALCRDCTCNLSIDQESLKKRFKELQIWPVDETKRVAAKAVGSYEWTIEIRNVVSLQVCSVVCLEHENTLEFNTWHYNFNDQICKCGWVHSGSCPEKMVDTNWKPENLFIDQTSSTISFFVQLKKTVPCGKMLDLFHIKKVNQLLFVHC